MISGKLILGIGFLSLVGAAIGVLLAFNGIDTGRYIALTLIPIGSIAVFVGAIAALTKNIKP